MELVRSTKAHRRIYGSEPSSDSSGQRPPVHKSRQRKIFQSVSLYVPTYHSLDRYWRYTPVWSNFEIADLDFWRSPAYQKFFEHLDEAGGFYYERWGGAPVHSIAAALLLPKDRLHFFADIGYRHEPFQRCPQGEMHVAGKCSCDPGFTRVSRVVWIAGINFGRAKGYFWSSYVFPSRNWVNATRRW